MSEWIIGENSIPTEPYNVRGIKPKPLNENSPAHSSDFRNHKKKVKDKLKTTALLKPRWSNVSFGLWNLLNIQE